MIIFNLKKEINSDLDIYNDSKFNKIISELYSLQNKLVDYLENHYPQFKNKKNIFPGENNVLCELSHMDEMRGDYDFVPDYVKALEGKDEYIANILNQKKELLKEKNDLAWKIRFNE